ncbi:MAG: DNA mismatch repair protein MutS [Verrucomicrobiota bacterium]
MSGKLTPMMEQYQRIKREIPSDALLLFRLGDFYEMFFEDARRGAEILNLTLTKRNGTPMCGVPYHAAQGYMSKLVDAGCRVALCEQTSEPKPGQIVEREVTQILSPGCTAGLELTAPDQNRFLAALTFQSGQYGFAFLDLTTAEFQVAEYEDWADCAEEFQRIRPREWIVSEDWEMEAYPEGLSRPLPVDGWIFEPAQAQLLLTEHFKVQSLDGFGCEDMAAGLSAAGALLYYARDILRSNVGHLKRIRPHQMEEVLIMDAATRRNLELVDSLTASKSNTTLLKALDKTATAMGARQLRRWLLAPLRQRESICARQLVVARLLEEIDFLDRLSEGLKQIRDLERLITRVSQGSANPRDLKSLQFSLQPLESLKELALELDSPLAKDFAERIQPLPGLEKIISEAIIDEPPVATKEGGILQDGFDPEVETLRSAMRDGKAWLAELQKKEQESTGIKSLKIRFNQVFGYYIEVTKSHLDQVPERYHRKQTLANAERYITPELKEMESKILGAEERVKQLEYERFQEIRDQAAAYTESIQETARALAEWDVLAGFAVVARLHHYCRPDINTSGKLAVEDGRHPVLEQLEGAERFVPNDVHLNEEECRCVILTGPNMAGKSTYIRQVALIALMAQVGSYVPAASAEVPVFDRIFTRVGASDDLSRGQSTFMVEMNETANILNNATSQSLVILDEIGRGTSTFDGLSIAWAVAEHLYSEIKAKTLFATHYHELTELAAILKGVKNYNVAVREWHDQVIFLRKIVPGGTDKSYGIQVARLAGLPKDVIERSKEILRNLEEQELDASGKPHLAAHRVGVGKKRRPRQKKIKEVPQMDLFRQGASRGQVSEVRSQE